VATRRLKDISLVPKKGWAALQEDGMLVKGLSFNKLLFHVEQYRRANNLPVPANVRRMVEDQICAAMEAAGNGEDKGRCAYLKEDDAENPPELRDWKHGIKSLVAFGKAVSVVAGELAVGKQVCVSREEAERRAGVCAQCPYNLNLGNCWSCGELGRLFRSVQGGLQTSMDSRLQSCDRCGCNLRTKVWVTGEALDKVEKEQGIEPSSFPSWCWRNP
jgi:hypothetical protein